MAALIIHGTRIEYLVSVNCGRDRFLFYVKDRQLDKTCSCRSIFREVLSVPSPPSPHHHSPPFHFYRPIKIYSRALYSSETTEVAQNTIMKPRYNELSRNRENVVVKTEPHYAGVLFHTFYSVYRNFGQAGIYRS